MWLPLLKKFTRHRDTYPSWNCAWADSSATRVSYSSAANLSQSEGSGLSFSTSWLGRGWPQETESKQKLEIGHHKCLTSWKNLCEKCFIWPHGLYSSWNSPGKNTGMGSLSLLQGIFPTQGLNPGLPHCRWLVYQLSHQGRHSLKLNVSKMYMDLDLYILFGSCAVITSASFLKL